VTTTDAVARHALFAEPFSKRPLLERWLPDQGGVRPAPAGVRTALQELVLGYLSDLKAAHEGAFGAAYLDDYAGLLLQASQLGDTRWAITLDDGSLLLSSYQNANNEAYSQVRNTRVTTPGSFALGGKGKLAMVLDGPAFAWENRAKATYRQATAAKAGLQVTQKTDDEIVLTSELRLKRLGVPLPDGMVRLVPFVNTNYTTQFVPDEADGKPKPRRAELNGVAGLVFNPGWGLKELRAGAVIKNDLANPTSLEPGFQAIGIFEQTLAPLPVVARAGFDVTRYLNTPYDTPDRLGLLADLTAGLTVPLWDRFNLNLTADYFLYQGKLPQTSALGSSFDFKVGLGYSLGFKPFYGVWF
jgi:hypothetical protein